MSKEIGPEKWVISKPTSLGLEKFLNTWQEVKRTSKEIGLEEWELFDPTSIALEKLLNAWRETDGYGDEYLDLFLGATVEAQSVARIFGKAPRVMK